MSSVRMDILYSPVPDNSIYMTFNGLGSEVSGLRSIGSGKLVTLKRGNLQRTATVQFRENGESFTNDLEISSRLASILMLRDNYRYRLTYDTKKNILSIVPSPTSHAAARLQSTLKPARNQILIGYELLSKLGIPESRSLSIVCRTSTTSKRLQVSTPSNLLDNSLRIDSTTISALCLVAGSYVSLSYNQNTKVLTLSSAKSATAAPMPNKSPSNQSNKPSNSNELY